MEEENSISSPSHKFYGSLLDQSTEKKSEIFNTNIDFNFNHYFCNDCNKFPFIKFCKDRKNVRLTCSCFNNKKISIEELFNKIYNKNSRAEFLFESTLNTGNDFKCEKHKKIFKGFSKYFLNNYCEDCYFYIYEKYYNDIIKFDEIRIEDSKIEEIIKKINDNKDLFEEISEEASNNFKLIEIKENTLKSLLEEEYKRFTILINIIINDYKKYPNFIHFFNIKNLLYFFNIEDESNEKEENIMNDNLIENNEPIIIEYINNISNKTKLFSKIFVKNNKNKCRIEIEGKRLELIEYYEFKTKERKVRVKLFIKKNILEINIYKMFAN